MRAETGTQKRTQKVAPKMAPKSGPQNGTQKQLPTKTFPLVPEFALSVPQNGAMNLSTFLAPKMILECTRQCLGHSILEVAGLCLFSLPKASSTIECR